ncbi:hypothetical protein [Flavobacterium sp. I3-2]|uniref:hypothetical protein n=1 Tax=Flavobacterium sp. I3-2 TaxID=2748319 RepID=UPI0015A89034|nr:hypothetical protein [Flavobacterium sp. I3-2]
MKGYYYLFYKLFIFWETISFPKFWSDIKAGISIVALELWLVLSLGIYYSVYTKKTFELTIYKPIVYIPLIAIIALNYLIFNHSNKWKLYNKEFSQLSKRKNIIGGIIVWGVIILIFFNLIFAFYLMSQIDWKQYK